MRTFALSGLVLIVVLSCKAQQLTATRFILSGVPWNGTEGALVGTMENNPLQIATTSHTQQPILFSIGDSGKVAEMLSNGDTWFRGTVFISPRTTGSLVLDAQSLPTTTSMLIKNIGVSGTEHAGIVLSSFSNGIGTGLRLGGPTGSTRNTLATGIDITGGTGIRYNALTAGNGTAFEIGKTVAPVRGIDVLVSGANQVGVHARANTNGSGLVGLSMSSAYPDPPISERTGVKGVAASNSTVAVDTLFGVQGIAMRSGIGGTQTISIATSGKATSIGTSHAGTAIGILGSATATAPGKASAIGVLAQTTDPSTSLSLVALGADVYLGSTAAERPLQLTNSALSIAGVGQNTTHMFDAKVSGQLKLCGSLSHTILRDSSGFELHLNNTISTQQGKGRVLRIQAASDSPEILLGSQYNLATGSGAVVLGGGRQSAPNKVQKPFSSIVGGAGNLVDAPYGFIGGGGYNSVQGIESVVVGSHDITIDGKNSFAFGYATTVSQNNTVVFHHNDVDPDLHTRVGVNNSNPKSQLDIQGTVALQAGALVGVPPGQANNLNIGISSIVPIVADAVESVLTGFGPVAPGRYVTLLVINGNLTLANENLASLPAQRIHTTTGADVITIGEAVITLWYDTTIQRWRVFSVLP